MCYKESPVKYAECCPKWIFVYLNRRCGTTHNMPPLLAQDRRLEEYSAQQSKSPSFQYQSVFTAVLYTHAANSTSSLYLPKLNVLRVSRIKTGKTFGPDEQIKPVGELASVISVLVFKTNKSLETDIRPKYLKCDNISRFLTEIQLACQRTAVPLP